MGGAGLNSWAASRFESRMAAASLDNRTQATRNDEFAKRVRQEARGARAVELALCERSPGADRPPEDVANGNGLPRTAIDSAKPAASSPSS